MKFSDLTDEQWSLIKPVLPPRRKGREKPRADDRRTVNAVLYVLTTGCRWMDYLSIDSSTVPAKKGVH